MRVEATSARRPYWLPAVPLKRESFIQPGSEGWNSEFGWFAKTNLILAFDQPNVDPLGRREVMRLAWMVAC